jgi:hypothetical protein
LIILGIVLLVLGAGILRTFGTIILVLGIVLLILGAVGRPVAGRRYWY